MVNRSQMTVCLKYMIKVGIAMMFLLTVFMPTGKELTKMFEGQCTSFVQLEEKNGKKRWLIIELITNAK